MSRTNCYKNFVMVLVATFMLLFPIMGEAHDLWLNLSHHYAEVGRDVKAYLGWGHSYPFSDFLNAEQVAKMQLITPSGKVKALTPATNDPGTKIKVSETGTYIIAVQRKGGYHTKTTTGYTSKSKKESKNVISSGWSEKAAKAILTGEKAGGNAYQKTLGHSIEIIPLADPATLHQGDYLPVKVLFKGKPLAKCYLYGTYVGFSTEGASAYTIATNKKGEAKIKIITPGIWRILAAHSYPAPDPTLCDEYKYAAALTFEVK